MSEEFPTPETPADADKPSSDIPESAPADNARVSRLSTPPGGTRIVVPPTTSTPPPADDDPVVREYERRYRPASAPADAPPREEPARGRVYTEAERFREFASAATRRRYDAPRSYSTMGITDDERLWAAVAHGSVWLTLVSGVVTAGTTIPISIFIPLIIFFVFRKKSDYVAFHALQAFVLQLIGTVGALALGVIGGVVWGVGMIVALLAMLVLVGFILVPLWGIVGLMLLFVVALLPFVMLGLGTVAAIRTLNRGDFRYPWIARWVDRQLASGYMHA